MVQYIILAFVNQTDISIERALIILMEECSQNRLD